MSSVAPATKVGRVWVALGSRAAADGATELLEEVLIVSRLRFALMTR